MFGKKPIKDSATQMIEEKQKLAISKGYDKLLSFVFNELLVHYKAWSTNGNEKWVQKNVSHISEKSASLQKEVAFKFENRSYRVTKEYSFALANENFYKLTLFLNDIKTFGITEKEEEHYATYYSTLSVDAFLNEDWVNDFIQIKNHYESLSKESQEKIERQMFEEKKKDFGVE